ncbi:MAG: nitroreductase [Rhodospirillaceae bacterium]
MPEPTSSHTTPGILPKIPQDTQADVVEHAIRSRGSIRAFLPKPVPKDVIHRILEAASHAPSGSNMQPWKVRVVSGAVKDRLCHAVCKAHDENRTPDRGFKYYPDPFPEPFLSRRRATGWGLYGLLGIERTEKQKMHDQHGRNFLFFDAPVGIMFTIDKRLEIGSWLDYGTFLQNIMVMARGLGLHTCPQAAWASQYKTVHEVLNIPEDQETLICGMALGWADTSDPVNTYRPVREPVESFTEFLE